ncbi:DUF123 domain-containing protein [Chloroflexota bacterium]
MKGSYILLIELPEEESVVIGSLNLIHFSHHFYAYVGSALGGLEPRLNRHLKKKKKLHWHIDYFLQKSEVIGIIVCETDDRIECILAQTLLHRFEVVSGFGSSDCRCPGHLFSSDKEMKTEIMTAIKPHLLDVRVVY